MIIIGPRVGRRRKMILESASVTQMALVSISVGIGQNLLIKSKRKRENCLGLNGPEIGILFFLRWNKITELNYRIVYGLLGPDPGCSDRTSSSGAVFKNKKSKFIKKLANIRSVVID